MFSECARGDRSRRRPLRTTRGPAAFSGAASPASWDHRTVVRGVGGIIEAYAHPECCAPLHDAATTFARRLADVGGPLDDRHGDMLAGSGIRRSGKPRTAVISLTDSGVLPIIACVGAHTSYRLMTEPTAHRFQDARNRRRARDAHRRASRFWARSLLRRGLRAGDQRLDARHLPRSRARIWRARTSIGRVRRSPNERQSEELLHRGLDATEPATSRARAIC